jgi:hypothetical protein
MGIRHQTFSNQKTLVVEIVNIEKVLVVEVLLQPNPVLVAMHPRVRPNEKELFMSNLMNKTNAFEQLLT